MILNNVDIFNRNFILMPFDARVYLTFDFFTVIFTVWILLLTSLFYGYGFYFYLKLHNTLN